MLIALIWSCWSRYPGIRMDVDREMPELRAPASHYDGRLWVAETEGRVVGMIATRPAGEGAWEICRVYVDPALHGGGLGHELLDAAERHAVGAGATRLILFSDTRFDRAHRFYEKRSYVRFGGIRVLHDISNSLEFGYAKPVDGMVVLDAAAAASAVAAMRRVLIACVDEDGGAAGFLPPLPAERATRFLRGLASGVGIGARCVAAAWRGGMVVGFGWLVLDLAEDQGHRAELGGLLVAPGTRRTGVGRAVMAALEREARAVGRVVLTAVVPAGVGVEGFHAALGWREAGRVPGYMRDVGGVGREAVVAFKRLG